MIRKNDIEFNIKRYRTKPDRLTLTCSECGVFYDEDIPKGEKRVDTNQTIWGEAGKHNRSEHGGSK